MKLERCQDVFALLSQYLDHELPADLCDQIEAHIADCPPCVAFLESLRKTVELCRKLQAGGVPAAARDEHRRALQEAYQRFLREHGGCSDSSNS